MLRRDRWVVIAALAALTAIAWGYCVGCCWMLMALLFVGGVMSVLWIAALVVLELAEKVIPAGRLISRIAGLGLIAWATYLLISALHQAAAA